VSVPSEPNLVLAGFMGTGKTTVGQLLAASLGRPFVDTDALVEAAAGMTIAEIFARQGEAAFRAHEREACREVAGRRGLVVAIGGGALLDPANRAALEGSGVLVLLTCERQTLAARLRESARRGERPLLAGDLERTIERLLEQREPVYSAVRLQVDTTRATPQQVAEQVLGHYRDAIASPVRAGAVG
jgi:shikimate kinase